VQNVTKPWLWSYWRRDMVDKNRLGMDPFEDSLGWIGKEEKQRGPGLLKKVTVEESQAKPAKSSTKRTGCKPGYTRVGYIVKEELVEKVRAYAYWERISLVEAMEEILESFFSTKKVKAIPRKK